MTKKDDERNKRISGAPGTYPEGLPDPAALAGLAAEFFPEFRGAAGPGALPPLPGIPPSPPEAGLSEETLREIAGSLYEVKVPEGIYTEPSRGRVPADPGVYNFPDNTELRPATKRRQSPKSYGDLRDYDFVRGVDLTEISGRGFGVHDAENIPSLVAAADPYISGFDVNSIRKDFPILSTHVNGRRLIWLDNAATTQKPRAVIDRLAFYYENENSNIHRGAHTLAARSTDAYEAAREKVRGLLNASSVSEIIFVRGATEGINLVAQSYGQRLQKDDEIVITWLEHHANIVPWQMICAEKGARLRVAPVDDSGQVLLNEYSKLLNHKTRIVSLPHVSNALGTITPVSEMIELAHRYGAKVLVDGAQAVSHIPVDVQAYDCDFYVFSGHKIFGPTGIGAVYGKSEILETMPPWQGGGI